MFRSTTIVRFSIGLLLLGLTKDVNGAEDQEKGKAVDHSTIKLVNNVREQVDSKDHATYDSFKAFVEEYDKHYDNEAEVVHRYNVFKQTLKRIEIQQKQSSVTSFGITSFSDLTPEEFVAQYAGTQSSGHKSVPRSSNVSRPAVGAAPFQHDWRESGDVSPVKHQGGCNCGYVFAAVAAVESHALIRGKPHTSLSEQEVLDCINDGYRGRGCEGGNIGYALRYIQDSGISAEIDYPYVSGDSKTAGTCDGGQEKVETITRFTATDVNEEKIRDTVYGGGPVTANIDARPLQDYRGGILRVKYDENNHPELNHSVLIVGYGEENGVLFWIVKNSWSRGFGEKGYARIERGVDCIGIASEVYLIFY